MSFQNRLKIVDEFITVRFNTFNNEVWPVALGSQQVAEPQSEILS